MSSPVITVTPQTLLDECMQIVTDHRVRHLPVVEEIGQEKGDALKVAKLNIDDNPDATRQYGVMSIPSLILFKGGEEVARVIGARPKDAIMRDIEPHLS